MFLDMYEYSQNSYIDIFIVNISYRGKILYISIYFLIFIEHIGLYYLSNL